MSTNSQRVLACVLCHQRKIKCDRRFPCANCTKSQAQCVQATVIPRRRKRRMPEQELMERLHHYENLLRQHDISFEPMPKIEKSYDAAGDDRYHGEQVRDARAASAADSETSYDAKNIWHTMSEGLRQSDPDSDSSNDFTRATAIKKAWDQETENNDHLLFGTGRISVNIVDLHPDPVKMFSLWQTYLDNVNPLLKVTHTPTLQARIVEAASNAPNINPVLEALLFSIYSVAVLSETEDNCRIKFKSSRQDLLTNYQIGAQQALLNCGFLRTNDRDCLTAFYLYLISIRPDTTPQSLSAMLGIAVRIAQRMGIHTESILSTHSPLEAEMRRRLWWSLVMFDSRACELANTKPTTLNPTWDCKIPLNVNDTDLRVGMKELPTTIQQHSSEALFMAIRCEIAEHIRHTEFHLGFTCPSLKLLSRRFQGSTLSESARLVKFEEMLQEKYFRFYDEGNPVHFIAIWGSRAYLAKSRLLEHHARFSESGAVPTEAERDAATAHALRVLECDTVIMTSPLTTGFRWLTDPYFPLPSYLQIGQDLRKRPLSRQHRIAWEIMRAHLEVWFDHSFQGDSPFFKLLVNMILQAWASYEDAASKQSADNLAPSSIMLSLKHRLELMEADIEGIDKGVPIFDLDMNFDDASIPAITGLLEQSLSAEAGIHEPFNAMTTQPQHNVCTGVPKQGPFDVRQSQYSWAMQNGRPS